jgi:sugar lactone lactonase YvrE
MGKTDGPSLNATFTEPIGLFVDPKGNVLVAGSGAIRQISPSGVVSTPTGKDFFSWPSGVTKDSSGNLYVTDTSVQTNPAVIAIGAGGNQIYKVSPSGQITPFAGSTTHGNTNGNGANASFNAPTGIVMDANGNLFVADYFNNEIRKITPSGDVTTFAGSGLSGNADGLGINASFYLPDQLAIDSIGNLYVADNGNREIRKISPTGNVTTLARGLDDPRGVAVDNIGNVYFSEYSTNAIKKIDLSGSITTIVSSPNITSQGNVSILDIKLPMQLALDSLGNLLVANRGNNDILKISLNTAPIATDSTTSVITTASSSPITVTGALSSQATTDAIKSSPFKNLTIQDPNAAQTETVTLTLSSSANGILSNTGPGTFNGSTGVYTVSGNTDSVNKAIQGLMFTPTPHQVTPGKTQTTTFKLNVVDTSGISITDTQTTVIVTANTTVSVKSAGTFSGANGTTSFLIDSGNYSTTITGFKTGDSIKFNFTNDVINVSNSSPSDSLLNITATDPANNNQVIVHLTGISASQEASISDLLSFNSNNGFGLGSLS